MLNIVNLNNHMGLLSGGLSPQWPEAMALALKQRLRPGHGGESSKP